MNFNNKCNFKLKQFKQLKQYMNIIVLELKLKQCMNIIVLELKPKHYMDSTGT